MLGPNVTDFFAFSVGRHTFVVRRCSFVVDTNVLSRKYRNDVKEKCGDADPVERGKVLAGLGNWELKKVQR